MTTAFAEARSAIRVVLLIAGILILLYSAFLAAYWLSLTQESLVGVIVGVGLIVISHIVRPDPHHP